MKVWLFSYGDDDAGSGIVHEWFPTKKEAYARYRELTRERNIDIDNGEYHPSQSQPINAPERVEIRTDRRGLLLALNRWANVG